MGDEGFGVHVARCLLDEPLPPGIECIDGGTGSFQLLEPMQRARRVVLIDATVDGGRPGSLSRLRPRFSSDYPPALTAHDIGLKDLLDALYLMGDPPEVTLVAVSISPLQELSLELSPELKAAVPAVARVAVEEAMGASA
jgi:hydrogenase maturation protease